MPPEDDGYLDENGWDTRAVDNPAINPHPGHCRVCDIAVMPRSRQYCDDHKPDPAEQRKARRQAANATRRPRALPPTDSDSRTSRQILLDEAERIVDGTQVKAVAVLAPWAPVVGGNWATRAEENTNAVLTIAAQHPKFLEGILKFAEFEAAFTLITFGVSTLVAVGIEIGFVAGDGPLAQGFDLDEIWLEVMRNRGEIDEQVAPHYDPYGSQDPQGFGADPFASGGLYQEV